jgi:hypothetical protein
MSEHRELVQQLIAERGDSITLRRLWTELCEQSGEDPNDKVVKKQVFRLAMDLLEEKASQKKRKSRNSGKNPRNKRKKASSSGGKRSLYYQKLKDLCSALGIK